MSMNGLVTL